MSFRDEIDIAWYHRFFRQCDPTCGDALWGVKYAVSHTMTFALSGKAVDD